MNIKILFEDKNLLVINKPAGISVHGDGKEKRKTISDWVLDKYPKLKKVGEPFFTEAKGGKKIEVVRPGIVHRLDRETSGVLVIAKNQKTFLFLKEQFQNHKIKKVYNAFVYGLVTDPKASLLTSKRGVVDVPIGRSPKDIRMWTAGRGAKEPLREARTEYFILKSFKDAGENFSFLEVYPKTGRTHQIRVHLRYINHPIVSDPLYRGMKDLALGIKRLALHAKNITLELPNGEFKTIEAPYPIDFKKVIDKYVK
jgi:23S rRNA pseudouridine1911/1915/1917 synthase